MTKSMGVPLRIISKPWIVPEPLKEKVRFTSFSPFFFTEAVTVPAAAPSLRSAARRLRALGAAVTGVCRSGRAEEPAFDRVLPVGQLNELLPQADALVMALPATAETAGILSRERIALLPPQALVVNVGRGSAIDQPALVEALTARRLAGAALDVMEPEPLPPDHPLWQCPNTILTPHVSGNMALGLTCDLDVDMFCRDLGRYAAGEPLENLVDRSRGY